MYNKNKELFIGVDNGLSGALVTLQNNKIIDKTVMPVISSTKNKREYDIQKIIEYFKKYPEATVILEKAHAMPVIGKVQAFQFGKNYGIIIGVLAALEMPYIIVHAKTWQTKLFKDTNTKDTKQASAIVAQRLFPGIDFRATERSKKISDGLTDAALIAYYGQYY